MSLAGINILTFAVPNWPRNAGPSTRASKPKVRTGCVTCKKRRVKCDESKPSCGNCAKRRIPCEGYHQHEPRPKGGGQKKTVQHLPSRTAGVRVLMEPTCERLVFGNQAQKDHFDSWLSFAGDALIFPSELITGLIPRIARSDPAVRSAASAIGAAALGASTREQRLLGRGPHYTDALAHYNRALRLTAATPATEDALPGVLMSCLLFFVFEALQGDRRAALTHVNHGYGILDQYERRAGGDYKRRTPLIDALVADFQRLTMQSWSHNGDHPQETADRVPWCCRGIKRRYMVDEMPDAFSNLDEAHRWWEITQHHVVHHAPLIIGFRVEGTGGSKSPGAFPADQALPIPADPVKGCQRFIERWRQRFLPLAEAIGTPAKTRDHLKMLGLRMHSTYLSIPVRTANYTDPEALASLTPAFREVVSLGEEFLEIQQQQRRPGVGEEVFTMDSSSPTWPLGAAAMLCADGEVRADATELLRDFPRRDGLWDTQAFLTMMEQFQGAKEAIERQVGGWEEEAPSQHVFDFEVVYDEGSVSWVKVVDDPAAVGRDALEYKIDLP
ncbi:C6 zinc finger domain protein [Colletotrichum musicola]|uniref:C6 zinc finger domain protein n=1 Tax=Colletotrichum musicola TaxID=2175873 RepID=A0A8H6J855_9PEZI|nr:C6 zinc finger domain protein [Colletotrichum musicola]